MGAEYYGTYDMVESGNQSKKIIVFGLIMTLTLLFVFAHVILGSRATVNIFYGRSQMLSGYEGPINENRLPAEIGHLEITVSPLNTDYIDSGIGTLAWPGIENQLIEQFPYGYFGDMILDSPQDIVSIHIANGEYEALDFILKLFYNYEEAYFRVLGATEYKTELIFTIDARSEVAIPVQLDSNLEVNEYRNKLTMIAVIAPEQFTAFHHNLYRFTTVGLNFEMSFGGERELELLPFPYPIYAMEQSMFYSINISQNLEEPEFIVPLPEHLQVSPNEVVYLAFESKLLNMILEDVENYLLISMLDWNQIEMSGMPYIFVETNENPAYGERGVFTIIAPEEPGFYEFVAFAVLNPSSPNSWTNFFPLEFSWRTTIEVVAE